MVGEKAGLLGKTMVEKMAVRKVVMKERRSAVHLEVPKELH
jgi:hypothetical protein